MNQSHNIINYLRIIVCVLPLFASCEKEMTDFYKEFPLQKPDLKLSTVDYNVYRSFFPDSVRYYHQVVIIQSTDTRGGDMFPSHTQHPYIDSMCFVNFYDQNKRSYQLDSSEFSYNPVVCIISEDEYNSLIVDNAFNWPEFAKRFPYARGFYRFSSIGFNQDSSQAILVQDFISINSKSGPWHQWLKLINGEWSVKWEIALCTL